MERDFKQLASLLKGLDPSIYCNDKNCYGKNNCEYYDDITPDYTLTIGKLSNFTIAGDQLFEHPGEKGGCQFALYNSGEQYILGEFFLQNFYSVYDVKHSKIGLGLAIDPHEPLPITSNPSSGSQNEKADPQEAFAQSIVAGSAILIGFMCIVGSICIYRKNKQYNRRESSRMQAFEEHLSNDESDSSSNHGS